MECATWTQVNNLSVEVASPSGIRISSLYQDLTDAGLHPEIPLNFIKN